MRDIKENNKKILEEGTKDMSQWSRLNDATNIVSNVFKLRVLETLRIK